MAIKVVQNPRGYEAGIKSLGYLEQVLADKKEKNAFLVCILT